MMKINVLAFGVAKDIFGQPVLNFELHGDNSVANLKSELEKQYPKLGKLASYMVAQNNEYALPDNLISETDEIAIIPPVSGG